MIKTCKRKAPLWLVFFLLIIVAPAQGEISVAPNWAISGQNSLHLDYYNSSGPNGAYLQEGWKFYNDFNLQFQNRANPYNTYKGYLSATLNESPYRSANYGVLIERFNFNQENGDFFIPYRLDLGDFYAFQTPRTLQRSLKGAQIEFQPGKVFNADQSVLLQLGSVAQDYMSDKKWENMFAGYSWLLNWKNTRLALNFTANYKDAQDEIPSLQQYVTALALNHNFSFLTQKLVLDTEWALFRGDIIKNGQPLQDSGQGRFVQLQGRSPVAATYSFRYEEYDADYRPSGGVVSGGRRVLDGRAGWRFATGYQLNGRAQLYRDGLGTDTVTDTDVLGLAVSGVIANPWLKGMNASIDAYRQHADADVSETLLNSLNMHLSAPFPAGWNAKISASLQDLNVQRGSATDSIKQQYGFDVGKAIGFAGFKGSASAGLSYYMLRQTGLDSNNPGLNLSTYLARDTLRVNISYRYILSDQMSNLMDNRNQGFNAAIEYAKGKHTLRAETDLGMHQPEIGEDSVDTRVALTWTYSFERPASIRPAPPAEVAKDEQEDLPPPETFVKIQTLADLSPYMPMKKALASLERQNIRGGLEEGAHVIFETQWFADVSQRQRLVLTKKVDYLDKASVVVDLHQVGELDTLAQLYERLQAQLIRTFGAPVTQEKGDFGPNIAAEIRKGSFVRVSDWKTSSGVLRLGIPRRLDGLVRIEVQHAESFPLSSLASWGLEEIR